MRRGWQGLRLRTWHGLYKPELTSPGSDWRGGRYAVSRLQPAKHKRRVATMAIYFGQDHTSMGLHTERTNYCSFEKTATSFRAPLSLSTHPFLSRQYGNTDGRLVADYSRASHPAPWLPTLPCTTNQSFDLETTHTHTHTSSSQQPCPLPAISCICV